VSLLAEIQTFFAQQTDARRGDRLVIAFSGGPDSVALAWALKQLEPILELDLQAVHIDHQLDDDSSRRSRAALELCEQLRIPCEVERRSIPRDLQPAESPEAAARRIRYTALETFRARREAAFVATAHHADDQIETLLIRLLYGTGVEGLAGIQARRGRLIRPLLGVERSRLRKALAESGLAPIEDPTNYNLGIVRNRVRQLIRPELTESTPDLGQKLLALSRAASGARLTIQSKLGKAIALRYVDEGPAFSRQALLEMPFELWPFALALVHREAGAAYPPTEASRRELARQIALARRIGCDCGHGWRWESRGDLVVLVQHPTPNVPAFAYTVEAPGECAIAELALRFRIRRGLVDAWMFQHSDQRAGLALPLEPGDQVVVRNRRPGDRVRPLGCRYTRRLKDILIDRGVPRSKRGHLPLLEVDSRLAWVPGVTIDEAYRVESGREVWIAELESL
jgi:tRNA(Ile)-lysidine synthase